MAAPPSGSWWPFALEYLNYICSRPVRSRRDSSPPYHLQLPRIDDEHENSIHGISCFNGSLAGRWRFDMHVYFATIVSRREAQGDVELLRLPAELVLLSGGSWVTCECTRIAIFLPTAREQPYLVRSPRRVGRKPDVS